MMKPTKSNKSASCKDVIGYICEGRDLNTSRLIENYYANDIGANSRWTVEKWLR